MTAEFSLVTAQVTRNYTELLKGSKKPVIGELCIEKVSFKTESRGIFRHITDKKVITGCQKIRLKQVIQMEK